MAEDKLWGGRFATHTHEIVESFTASAHIDWRLYNADIDGSVAHAQMLGKVGVLTDEETDDIVSGLEQIRTDIQSGNFKWLKSHEDVHMNIEARLTQLIGDVGKKLHTARSRNDQVATDMRLFLRTEIDNITTAINQLELGLIDQAEKNFDVVMPGFTHLQTAQPVTLGHHLLAWVEMLERDFERFMDCRKRLNVSPLGSAALAGSSFAIDRQMTAAALDFESVSRNSLDAVSDRDFLIEFNAAAATLMMHFSRIGEELVLWSSAQFEFVDLGDAFCTGSSIMPQKKNPDVAELLRGKVSRVTGNLMATLMLMKSQPLAYNRDNQEDKEPLFDSVDSVLAALEVLSAMVPQMRFKQENMFAAASRGYATATDLADYLVNKAIPFRDAHGIVGRIVGDAIHNDVALSDLSIEQLQSYCAAIEADVFDVLTLQGSVNARDQIGGTAPQRVKAAVHSARVRVQDRMTG